MAIDTAEKRRAASGVPAFWALGITPNSAKDSEWRYQAAWSYDPTATADGGGSQSDDLIVTSTMGFGFGMA